MKRYEMIFIDADETLFDFSLAESSALSASLNEFRVECDEERCLERYREINRQLWLEFEQGKVTKDDLRSTRFRRLFDEQGLQIDVVLFGETYLRHLGMGTYLIPGAEEICAYLHGKYRLAIITNGITEVQKSRLGQSSLRRYIDHLIISEEAGSNKPHPGIFEYALKATGHHDKSSALMLGDSLTADIAGGAAFGIDTCWFNPSGGQNASAVAPTYEIRSLLELKELL